MHYRPGLSRRCIKSILRVESVTHLSVVHGLDWQEDCGMWQTQTLAIADCLSAHQENMADRLFEGLVELIYEHRSYLRPTQLRRVAQDIVTCAHNFLQTNDIASVRAAATRHTAEGLGLQGVLWMMDSLKSFLDQHMPEDIRHQGIEAINAFASIYLQEFVNKREAIILEEQERIRAAMQRSLSHNNMWLQTAAEVSRVATSTLNLNKLLRDSVKLIQKHFDFFHVGLYLIDQAANNALLLASSGETDTRDASLSTIMPINRNTLVGNCILDMKAYILTDSGTRDFRRDGIVLADTRSVMTVPIISRNQAIGVMVIQSKQLTAFGDDDITRLQTLADQIANAIQNARLYYELELHSQNLAQAVKARTMELEKTKERVEAILDNSPDAILLLAPDGRIELCNYAFHDMFGYSPNEVETISLPNLVEPDNLGVMDDLLRSTLENGQTKWFQTVGQRRDGTTFDIGGALAVIADGGAVTALVCSLRDITEQVRAEDQIKQSLREKEVLLREIHHRVKNNMQVISSLLALQAGYTEDEQANQMFRESQNRIRSMALVHELLYQSRDLARIDFVQYVHKLSRHLLHSYLTDAERIRLDIMADALFLDIDMAIPCGLIINELISNALKHAFPNGKEGAIRVELHTDGNGLSTIIVRDNGVGLPEDLDVHQTETLGLQLVTSLAGQLNATIGLLRHPGTTFEIRFALFDTAPLSQRR